MVNRIEEKRGSYNYERKAGAPAPKKKTLADIMKTGRREANAARKTAEETQEFLKWALQNCKNQEDLDAIRDLVNTHGSAKQRKTFEKLEYDLTHISGKKKAAISGVISSLEENARNRENSAVQETPANNEYGSKKARRAEIAKQREAKLAIKENFRQAMYNAESVEDLKALELEYGKKFTGSLKATYNARFHALEKAAREAEALHAETQSFYNKLFGYGNGKHPSVTTLGGANPTSSTGMNWERYAAEHGLTYTKPEVSGVVRADLLAEEAIERTRKHNEMQAVYEELFKDYEEPKPPVSEPPIDKPPVTEPPIDRPPVAEPPIDKPPVAEPPIDKPPVAEPPIDKPPVIEEPPVKKPKFKLGKKGKFALAALALGAIGAGIAYFVNKNKKAGNESAPVTNNTTNVSTTPVISETPSDSTNAATSPADSIDIGITPPVVSEEPVDTIEQQVVSEIPFDDKTGKYIVRKGDNCWNIAKAELIKEKGGEIPTDEEVLKRTYKILERNDLHFEKDKYTVLIYPNDTLDIKM